MNLVPDGRDGKLQVGIVGEQGFPGSSVSATHDPVVAAQALTNFAFGFMEKF